jgi:hypothetical protein
MTPALAEPGAEAMPIKVIAWVMGGWRNTVRAAVASDRPRRYERQANGSITDAIEPRIRELLAAYPTMPTTVIAERTRWDRSIRVARDRVAAVGLPCRPSQVTHPSARR